MNAQTLDHEEAAIRTELRQIAARFKERADERTTRRLMVRVSRLARQLGDVFRAHVPGWPATGVPSDGDELAAALVGEWPR